MNWQRRLGLLKIGRLVWLRLKFGPGLPILGEYDQSC